MPSIYLFQAIDMSASVALHYAVIARIKDVFNRVFIPAWAMLRIFKLYLLIIPLWLSAGQAVYAAETVRIDIEGVKDELLNNARAYLSLERQKEHPHLTPARIKRLHEQAPDEIKRALQPFGYYKASVSPDLTPPANETAEWTARYRIDPGPPLMLKNVTVDIFGAAKNDEAFRKLLAGFPVKTGDILNHGHYEKGKLALRNLALERGYFKARLLTREIRIDKQAYTASIVLSFDSGPRYRLGETVFQQDAFSESLLRQFLNFQPGDYYHTDTLLAFRETLNGSDYFQTMDLKTRQLPELEQVNLEVVPTPAKPNKFQIRLGYGTDTGPRTQLSWLRRYVNRRGHRFQMETAAMEYKKKLRIKAGYRIPTGSINADFLAMTLAHDGENLYASEYDMAEDGADKTRQEDLSFVVSKHHPRSLLGKIHLDEVLDLTYLMETYDLFSLLFSPEDRELIETGGYLSSKQRQVVEPNYRVLIPGINWTYTDTDNPMYAARGQQIQLGLQGSAEGLGSNLSFWQVRLRTTFIRKLHKRGRIIIRSDTAYTDAKDVDLFDTSVLPKKLQFRTGGSRSVRGYEFEELDLDDALVNGKHLLTGSIEYEHKFLEKWGAAVFLDIGNVFNDYSRMKLKRGAGIGLRWYSPVGPIRLDIATPIDEPERSVRVHLNIGPDF
ncbi:MAG: outer membrane protein assembly factor [Gammaproteobacteria bacterium]|nr:outer membrane protein assembly factor [Gammaproteobacteria bacterium]